MRGSIHFGYNLQDNVYINQTNNQRRDRRARILALDTSCDFTTGEKAFQVKVSACRPESAVEIQNTSIRHLY